MIRVDGGREPGRAVGLYEEAVGLSKKTILPAVDESLRLLKIPWEEVQRREGKGRQMYMAPGVKNGCGEELV